jgi:hypothetical protein
MQPRKLATWAAMRSFAGVFGDFLVLLVVEGVAVVPHHHRTFAVEVTSKVEPPGP